MVKTSRRLVCLAGAVSVSIGVGCSSGDSSPTSTTTTEAGAPDASGSGSASGSSSGSGSGSSGSGSSGSGSSGSGSSGSGTGMEGGAVPDATVDASVGAETGAGPDSASDASTGVDAGLGTDAGVDAGSDAGMGSDTDLGSDAGMVSDGESDASAEAAIGADAGLDGSAEASSDAGTEAGPLFNYTFDTTTEGWSILTTSDGTLSSSTLLWTGALGDPTAGAIEATIPFTTSGQSVELGFRPSPLLDLTGKVVTMHVYLASGLSADGANPGGVQVFLQDGPAAASPYLWVTSGWQNLGSANLGQWITVTLDVTAVVAANPAFDPTQVGAWGIQINTGGLMATPAYSTAVVAIDTVTVQ